MAPWGARGRGRRQVTCEAAGAALKRLPSPGPGGIQHPPLHTPPHNPPPQAVQGHAVDQAWRANAAHQPRWGVDSRGRRVAAEYLPYALRAGGSLRAATLV